MTQRMIKTPLEKCLDCLNFEKHYGKYECIFGLIPVILPAPPAKKGEARGQPTCECYGFLDLIGKEAPAHKELLKRAKKVVKYNTKHKEKK